MWLHLTLLLAVLARRWCLPAAAASGLVKPDIVFFGEQLPDRFYERMEYDLPTCDLLLVMGTSLVVHPFASLIGGWRQESHAAVQTVHRALAHVAQSRPRPTQSGNGTTVDARVAGSLGCESLWDTRTEYCTMACMNAVLHLVVPCP